MRGSSLREPGDVQREEGSALPLALLLLIDGRWWSGSALWPGWQEKQVPVLGCRIWSEFPAISPPLFSSYPSLVSPGAEGQRALHVSLPGLLKQPSHCCLPKGSGDSPGASGAPVASSSSVPGWAQSINLKALPLFAEGTGSPRSFFAGGCGRRGCCGSRWSLMEGLGASSLVGWGGPFHRSAGGGLACLSHGQFPAECLYGIMLLFI